jgi:hypothetical protein
MKRSILLFTSITGILYLSLTSYSSGPSTGAGHVAVTGCGTASTCHGAKSSNTHVTISIARKSNNQPVTDNKYNPDSVYKITITGHNAGLTNYGYQFSATKGSTQAGSFTNIPSGSKTSTTSSLSVVEQSSPITAGSSGLSLSFEWKAPAAGSGNVALSLAVNAVNKDNSINGDAYSSTQLTLSEQSVGISNTVSEDVSLKAYPNPVSNKLSLDLGSLETGNYRLTVTDLAGKVVLQNNVINAAKAITVNTTDLARGIYHLQLTNNEIRKTITFVKE